MMPEKWECAPQKVKNLILKRAQLSDNIIFSTKSFTIMDIIQGFIITWATKLSALANVLQD